MGKLVSNGSTDSTHPEIGADQVVSEHDDPSVPPADDSPRLIVGIGASAGGLEALELFFEHVPADSGMVFIVVQHLSPNFASMMDELLARRTKLPVAHAQHDTVIQPNHVYVLAPGRDLIVSDGRLLVTRKADTKGLDLPIDRFFVSLAAEAGSRAVAVVLSGTGSDGSRGVVAVHQAGGLVVTQTVESAKFDGMPKAAQETGLVDLVLSPDRVPEALVRYADHPLCAHDGASPADILPSTEGPMESMFRLLRNAHGIDFSNYKSLTIGRRVERRLLLGSFDDLADYAARLEDDPDELNRLYQDLLIGVTEFFRDAEAFKYLEKQVIPELVANAEDGTEVRFWTAATATGEEAYSLAILLAEAIEKSGKALKARIFATDVHEASLQTAMLGLYDEDRVANVGPERLHRYFTTKPGGYQIHPDIRRTVVFAKHDIVRDPPFTDMDFVSCRNLIIYLKPEVQKRVLSLLHFGIRIEGVLWLGPSETLGDLRDEFTTVHEHWRVYRKVLNHNLTKQIEPSLPDVSRIRQATPSPPAGPTRMLETYDRLLERFMPPAILVGEDRRLLHVFGGAGRFLATPDGRPTEDVFDGVSQQLRSPLSAGIERALAERASVVLKGAPVDDGDTTYTITVDPVFNRHSKRHDLLVRFEPEERRSDEPTTATSLDMDEAARARLERLETELRFARENLQTTIQEHEATTQELQATNEELVAANEQMQSTNEELHSVNEELYTVNAEHQRKIAELVELTNDMENFLNSTDVDTIFLDRDLRIRRFTPGIAKTFNLIPQDVGRPIGNFTYSLDCDPLVEELEHVLSEQEFREREVRDRHGRRYLLRLYPYVALGEVDGIVLTLIDVESLKRVEDELRELSAIVEHSRDAVFRIDFDGIVRTWNRGASALFGIEADAIVGKNVETILSESQRHRVRGILEAVRHGKDTEDEEYRRAVDGRECVLSLSFSPISDEHGAPAAVAVVGRDVTSQRLAEDEVRDSVVRRDHFLTMLSHELRNPLNAIRAAGELLERESRRTELVDSAATVVNGQTTHMARLLDDLLDVARITQDRLEMKMVPFDLRTTATGAVEEVERDAAGKNVRLEVELPEESLVVDGDPARLQQVQANLLSNAVKFTEPGGLVRVRLDRDGENATIEVADDGIGMTAEFVERAFELFVQADGRRVGNEAGMGVGLALVKRIVEKHDGRVSVTSPGPGQGSRFTVVIPISSNALPANAPEDDNESDDTTDEHSGNGHQARLVVIEDNDDNRDLFCKLLRLDGYEVHEAATGEEGIRCIVEQRPHVALVDIDLEDISGYDIAREIRSHEDLADVRLVALTGFGRDEDRRRSSEAGFDEHLVKPFDPKKLKTFLASSRSAEPSA